MSDTRRPRTPTPRSARPAIPGSNARPPATGSLIAQIVAEQKQQKAAMRKAMRRTEKRSKVGPVAVAVLILANVVAWAVYPPSTPSGDQRTPAQVEQDLRVLVASAASQVNAWRQTHDGHLPPTLAAAGVADSGLVLVNVDGTIYEVRGQARDVRLSYRSNTQLADFLDAGLPVVR